MDSETTYDGSFGSTSYTLIDAVQDNCGVAWKRLVRLYTPLVCYWCKQASVPEDEIPEIAQEVFVGVHSGIGNFSWHTTNSSFRGWIRTITQRKIADYFRKLDKQISARNGSTAFAIVNKSVWNKDEEPVGGELELLYRQAIDIVDAEFNDVHKNAFVQMVIESRKAKEVSENLGISENAVYMARHHILSRLRSEFEGLID